MHFSVNIHQETNTHIEIQLEQLKMNGGSITVTLIDQYRSESDKPVSSELKRKEKNFDADSYNTNGIWYMRECEYKKAFEEFDRAYRLCSLDYAHRNAFKNNMKLAHAEALNLEGDKLLKQKNFAKSLKMYAYAIERCPNKTSCTKFRDNVSKAKNAWAEEINTEGINLLNKCDYTGAVNKFREAIKKCSDDYSNKQSFKDNFLHAEVKRKKSY